VRSRRYVFRVAVLKWPPAVNPSDRSPVVEVPWLEADCDGFVLEERAPRRVRAVADDEARAEHTERAVGP
jgi:hypothetical protein